MDVLKLLAKRVLDISYKHKLSHLGSCLTALPLIYQIYNIKKPTDIFILSAGHSAIALYVVLEHFYHINAEEYFLLYGIHPTREKDNLIDCSTGSLGCGLSIGVGYAIANPDRDVYVLTSDGEMYEGVIWESLYFLHREKLKNIHIWVNCNSYSAYSKVDIKFLKETFSDMFDILEFFNTDPILIPNNLDAHYKILTKEEHENCVENLQNY